MHTQRHAGANRVWSRVWCITHMAVSKNTGVRKACCMGGMVRKYDLGHVSEVWFVVSLALASRLSWYDSWVWLGHDSRQCNMPTFTNSVYVICGNTLISIHPRNNYCTIFINIVSKQMSQQKTSIQKQNEFLVTPKTTGRWFFDPPKSDYAWRI